MSNVTIEVCIALVRELLAGYRGYPNTEAGERRFAFALQVNCVSVSHARATLQIFDEGFPTVRQIHDVAFNLRPKFEPQDDNFDALRAKYGNPQPFDVPNDELACHWRAFRDAIYYGWESRKKDEEIHPDSVAFIRAQIEKYGMAHLRTLDASPEPGMPYTNPLDKLRQPKSFHQVAALPITQADIDRVERAQIARKTTEQVDADLDSWSDPDR